MMEKHFNDNYMESADYPKATFKGIIEGFNWNIIGTAPKEFKLNGTLKLHGKSKKIGTIAILRKVDGRLEIIADFDIRLRDFNIEIPEMLCMKVSETVNVKTLFLIN
jgi:polyisoprenoid-binding protein YceI